MGMLDNIKGQFVETLINRIVDTKKIELNISFNEKDKGVITDSDNILENIVNTKDVKVEVEFKSK